MSQRSLTAHIIAFIQRVLPRPNLLASVKSYIIHPVQAAAQTLRDIWNETAIEPKAESEEEENPNVFEDIEQVPWGAYHDVEGGQHDAEFGYTLGTWPGKGPFEPTKCTTTTLKGTLTTGSDQLTPLSTRGENKFTDVKQNESMTRPVYRNAEIEEPLSHRSMGTLFKQEKAMTSTGVPKSIEVNA